MAAPIRPEDRNLWPPYLSDLPGLKVILNCKRCGIRKQFDGQALLARLDEDTNVISLNVVVSKKMGWERALTWSPQMCFLPRCEMELDRHEMDRINSHLPSWHARRPG